MAQHDHEPDEPEGLPRPVLTLWGVGLATTGLVMWWLDATDLKALAWATWSASAIAFAAAGWRRQRAHRRPTQVGEASVEPPTPAPLADSPTEPQTERVPPPRREVDVRIRW